MRFFSAKVTLFDFVTAKSNLISVWSASSPKPAPRQSTRYKYPRCQMPYGEPRQRVAPIVSDGSGWSQNEQASAKFGMGDGDAARAINAACPQHDIEIEHTGAPTPTASLSSEACFQSLQMRQHLLGLQRAFHHCRGISIAAPRRAQRDTFDDWGGGFKAQRCIGQRLKRCGYNAARRTKAGVPNV